MLKYDFENRKKGSENESKYEYLYNCLKSDIVNGKLAEGSKLPSKRALAEENGISVKTVMNAYEQLLMEGYITSRERSGYYVVSDFDVNVRHQKVNISLPAPEEDEKWFADFTANTTVYEKFPFSMWTKVMRQVMAEYSVKLVMRGDFLGSQELRAEIARYLFRTRGMLVSPECIVIGTGIEYLYSKMMSLLPEDAVYAVEDPGYRKIQRIYEQQGVKWKCISMGKGGINMSSLRSSDATVVHTSPEHHYPLGTVMSARRRQELLAWLEESENRYIIEDDYDCEFRYSGHAIPALYGLDYTQHVIYMNTFSKTLSPGIRISYMVLPEKLLRQYVDTANFFSNTSSNLEQFTLAHFIRDGYFDRHLSRMRKYYLKQGETLKSMIMATPQIPVKEISGMQTGTHVLVKLKTSLSDREIKERARERGINLKCLSEFCISDASEYTGTLVLNYSGMDESRMLEVMQVLASVFR